MSIKYWHTACMLLCKVSWHSASCYVNLSKQVRQVLKQKTNRHSKDFIKRKELPTPALRVKFCQIQNTHLPDKPSIWRAIGAMCLICVFIHWSVCRHWQEMIWYSSWLCTSVGVCTHLRWSLYGRDTHDCVETRSSAVSFVRENIGYQIFIQLPVKF
jgi:hypothetical protein